MSKSSSVFQLLSALLTARYFFLIGLFSVAEAVKFFRLLGLGEGPFIQLHLHQLEVSDGCLY